VQGADLQTTLQRAEAAGQRLEALIDAGTIAGFDSAARFLPSLATQARRRAALPDTPTLQAALARATAGGPGGLVAAERLQPFVHDVAAARQAAPLTPDTLRGSAVAPLVDALLLRRADGSAAALLPLQAPPGRAAVDEERVRQALADLPDAQVLDVGAELGSLYARYLGQARTQALLGGAAVLLLMALWLRAPRRLWAVCQPLLLAPLLTLGGLAALGTPLGILHLVGLLLVVAVGSNYALFFDMLREGGSVDDDTAASLLLANLTTVSTFGILSLSGIPVLAAIGHVVAPGALLALVLAAAFAPRPRNALDPDQRP
jgi:predicted exporter